MQIPSLAATTVTLANAPPTARDWVQGQVLQAVVQRASTAHQETSVRVGNLQLTMSFPIAVPEGGRVQLQVLQAGAQPTLRLLLPQAPGSSPSQSGSTTGAQPAAPPISALLPTQGSQAPLLATLWSLRTTPGALAGLPAGIQAGIKQLLNVVPTVDQVVQPGELRRSILSSGLFHEASLAALAGDRGRAPPIPDLKSALLSVASQLRARAARTTTTTTTTTTPAAPPGASGATPPGTGTVASPAPARAPTGSGTALPSPTPGPVAVPASAAGSGAGSPPKLGSAPGAGVAAQPLVGERRPVSPEQVARPAPGPRGTSGASAAPTGPLSPVPHTAAREVPPPLPGSMPLAQGRAEVQGVALSQPILLEMLRAQTEKAVARLTLHQWSSSESLEPGHARWLLELPVRNQDGIDIVHFSIDREGGQDGEDTEPAWRVELAFELPELGPIHARLAISGNRVSANLWMEDAATVERARTELWRLQEALEKRMLQVTHMGCTLGHPPRPPQSEPAPSFVDDRA